MEEDLIQECEDEGDFDWSIMDTYDLHLNYS